MEIEGDGEGQKLRAHLHIILLSHVTEDKDRPRQLLLQGPTSGLCRKRRAGGWSLGLREEGLGAQDPGSEGGGCWGLYSS